MIAQVIDIFLFASCVSLGVVLGKSSSVEVSFYSHFTPRHKFTSCRPACSGIHLSVSLWTRVTNGSVRQQPSSWQQNETCCAAYFLSANLQLPSKPLPVKQTGLLHVKLIRFTSFPLSSSFLLMWHNMLLLIFFMLLHFCIKGDVEPWKYF